MFRTFVLFGLVISLAFSRLAFASEVNGSNYDIYWGDMNGDGLSDFFFKAKALPIIIFGDISVPLILTRGTDFVIYRSGTSFSAPLEYRGLSQADVLAKLANNSLRRATSGDNYIELSANNGQTSILLKSNEIGVWDLLLVSSINSSLPSVSVKESSSSSLAAGSPQLAWRGVVSGMINNNPDAVAKYIAPNVVARYTSVFAALGKQLAEIGNQLGMLEQFYISDSTAIFLIPKKGDDGIDYIHAVTFVKNSDGNWYVSQL